MLSLIFNAVTISINLLSNFGVNNSFYHIGLSTCMVLFRYRKVFVSLIEINVHEKK